MQIIIAIMHTQIFPFLYKNVYVFKKYIYIYTHLHITKGIFSPTQVYGETICCKVL